MTGTKPSLPYPDSVAYLYSLGNEVKSFKFGLEGIREALLLLGNPERDFRSIHVAGTNGKGSTCAMIAAGLRAAGFKTGLYTSPHLIEPTERIQIDGLSVTEERFAQAFNTVHEAAEKLETHTSYFETVTAMAFLIFAEEKVDYAVIEVGLGGRLDATNTIQPELCVITPVDFDHEAYLGNSLEAIAGEKAGILKPGVPAVLAAQRPEAARVLEAAAESFIRTSEYRVEHLNVHRRGSEFQAARTQPLHVRCPLSGRHQIENAVTAVAALEQLQVPASAIEQGIAAAKWPGRLELVQHAPDIVLDGAHNPAGARALAAHIREFYSDRKIWLIYGAMRDKSVQEITEILFPLADEVIATAPAFARAVRPEVLREASDHPSLRTAPGIQEALQAVHEATPDDVIFITGSLYLVGEARGLLVE